MKKPIKKRLRLCISITAISATTLTVAIKKHDGSAGTAQTIYWHAGIYP